MENYIPSPFKKFQPEIDKGTNIIVANSVSQKVTITKRYDRNSPSAQSERKAEELFSSFTANIIKEETLFIR